MRAAVVQKFGEAPAVREFPDPEPGDGEVVVDVTLGSLNPVDRLRAEGYEYLNHTAPFVAGREGVGRVGDRRVYFNEAMEPYGSFAPRALVRVDELLDIPAGLSDEMTLPLGIAGLSGWLPLTFDTQLIGGERVLVTGATGMVGQISTQAAKLLGASYVVAAGRHVETLHLLLERGADDVVVLGDNPSEAIAAVSGEGFDVVVDCVFGAPFAAALSCTAPGGTVVVVGLTAGTEVALEFFALYQRSVISHSLNSIPVEERQRALNAMAEHALCGRLRVDSDRYRLADIEVAWAELLRGAHRKLLIAP
jgi:NADPH:quinone reductase-like Zn-dependent oxidoreductase